jgi:uncharacterized iron-regulated membrane protein
MLLRQSQYVAQVAGTSRHRGSGLVTALVIFLGVYAGIALCFYWLMQPSVAKNSGLAAYQPPPKTVVIYADMPRVPPAPSERLATLAGAEPAQEIAEKSTAAPKQEITKQETNKREARHAPRRERVVRERQNPMWDFASSRSHGGYRPWF